MGYRIYLNSHPLTLYLILLCNTNVCKITGCVANRADRDQMPHSVASDLGLHCLLRPVFPNT